jgi:hypothetical protein
MQFIVFNFPFIVWLLPIVESADSHSFDSFSWSSSLFQWMELLLLFATTISFSVVIVKLNKRKYDETVQENAHLQGVTIVSHGLTSNTSLGTEFNHRLQLLILLQKAIYVKELQPKI